MTHSPEGDAAPAEQLRAALAAGRVTPHYQPIVDIRSGRILQLEALARWTDGERGSIPPSEFIPLAERSGLVGSITTLMIERALADVRQWQPRVPNLRVAVNLSAESLGEAHLPEQIGHALAASGCEPGSLCLEVTESVLMARPESSRGHVERLRALGVHVAIDDFGTGFSSLKYLQLLPVDTIKIDRQFIETSVGSAPGRRPRRRRWWKRRPASRSCSSWTTNRRSSRWSRGSSPSAVTGCGRR